MEISAISQALGYILVASREGEEAREVSVSSFANGQGSRITVQNPVKAIVVQSPFLSLWRCTNERGLTVNCSAQHNRCSDGV